MIVDEDGAVVARRTIVASIAGRRVEVEVDLRITPGVGWGAEVRDGWRAAVASHGGVDWMSGEAKVEIANPIHQTVDQAMHAFMERELRGTPVSS